jgi:hypothetical protein
VAGTRNKRVLSVLALFGVLAVTGSSAANAAHARTIETQAWYWSEQLVATSLYKNGINWPPKRHDRVSKDVCWGVGYPVGNQGTLKHYRYFWCEVTLRGGTHYNTVVNVVAQSQYSVNFAGSSRQPPEYWSEQYVADALVSNGIRWGNNMLDPVSNDYCDGFGRSLSRGGTRYFKNFFCAVGTSTRQPYFVVIDVDGLKRYSVYWVDYDLRPRAAAPTPPVSTLTPTATSSASGGGVVTPSNPSPSNPAGAASNSTAPTPQVGIGPRTADGGYIFVGGGEGLGTLAPVGAMCQQTSASACTDVTGTATAHNNATAGTRHVWGSSTYCEDPRDGHYFSC